MAPFLILEEPHAMLQGHRCSTNAMDWAAAFGQLEVVKWLSVNRSEGCTKNAMGEVTEAL